MKATFFFILPFHDWEELSYFSRKEEGVSLKFRKSFRKCCQIFTIFEKSSSVKDLESHCYKVQGVQPAAHRPHVAQDD